MSAVLLALSVVSPQGTSLGPTASKVFDQRGGSIGRLETNDWTLPDPEKFVSTRHAVIRFEEGAYYLEDASTNGTFINATDQPVGRDTPTRLNEGDRLFIGTYEILVQIIQPVVRAEPAPAKVAPPRQEKVQEPDRQDLIALVEQEDEESPPVAADTGVQAAHAVADDEEIDAILGIVVQGLIDVLQSRTHVKSQFRMNMTSVRPVENNPLKFSLNAREGLHNLFVKRNPGYLPAQEAFREALADISAHQLAVLAGIRAGFNCLLASLHPDRLEGQFTRHLRRASLLGAGNRLRYWGLYRAHFEDIEKNQEAYFQLLFGEEFARAYEEQLQKLAAAGRQERK
jgi:predicted component of type VI protein secretion system